MSDTTMPTDIFSRRRRELMDDPGSMRSESLIPLVDFYGNFQQWLVETFRHGSEETIFLAMNDHEGGRRYVLPPEVAAAMYRQRDHLIARARKRGARQAVETKRAKGQVVGNPDAFRKNRRGKK
jgi:hypothetical protein